MITNFVEKVWSQQSVKHSNHTTFMHFEMFASRLREISIKALTYFDDIEDGILTFEQKNVLLNAVKTMVNL